MLLQPVPDYFCFPDVGAWSIGGWIAPCENIDTGLFEFLSCQEVIKFGAGRSDSFAGPIGDNGYAFDDSTPNPQR